MGSFRLIVKHAKQAVLVCKNREKVLCGEAMKNIALLEEDGQNGISIVINGDGLIETIGYDADIEKEFSGAKFEKEIDARGMCVMPGLIDGHTHPVWAGDRVHEFALKLAGATYMEVHQAGGGIGFTVDHTRRASEEELFLGLRERLGCMMAAGTTLAECKSGYGLDMESEVKMLKVIERAKRSLPIEISSTFCGAHSIPKGSTAEETTEDVINVQLPEIKRLMDKGELSVENIDVFCEKGVFDAEQTRRILEAGVRSGLAINFHGDELHPMKSGQLGAALGARAISHLEEVSEEGVVAMAAAGVVGVLLPTTAYILRLPCPPARLMIDCGVPVALGSDFNPNAFCLSMPLVMHLACVNLRMSMSESLVAATINAAASLGRSHTHGSLETGKVGDLLIIRAPKWEHLIYQLGGHDHIIKYVIKKGLVVHERK